MALRACLALLARVMAGKGRCECGGVFLTKKGKGMKVIKELVVAGVIGTSAFVSGGISGQFVSVPWVTGDDFTTYKQDMGKDMLELERRMGARIDASADRVINALKK